MRYAKQLPNFRGIFMRDDLPLKIRKNECGIVNLDISSGPGTHWTAYVKNHKSIIYFDSYGNLRPPNEVISYFFSDGSSNNISYNHDQMQRLNSYNCGQLCLKFLYNECK